MKKKVLPAKMVLQASSSYPTRRPARPKTSPPTHRPHPEQIY